MILSIVVSSFITYYIAIESSKIRKPSTESIANESSVSFKSSLVDTKKIGEHRVYSPVDSGSSSSSGGGGGGGGGSSGGGGGHSF